MVDAWVAPRPAPIEESRPTWLRRAPGETVAPLRAPGAGVRDPLVGEREVVLEGSESGGGLGERRGTEGQGGEKCQAGEAKGHAPV